MWDGQRENWFCANTCSPPTPPQWIVGRFILSPLTHTYWVPTVSSPMNSKAFIGHQLWGDDLRELFSNESRWPLIWSPRNFVDFTCTLSAARSQQPSWRHLPSLTSPCLLSFQVWHLRHLFTPSLYSLVHFTVPTSSHSTQGRDPRCDHPNVTPGMEEEREERGDEEDNYNLLFHCKVPKPKSWGEGRSERKFCGSSTAFPETVVMPSFCHCFSLYILLLTSD